MKYLVSLLTFVMCCIKCVAQTYIEPVYNDMLNTALANDSIAEYYTSINKLDSAIYYKSKVLDIYSQIYEESDTLYTDCIYDIACLHFDAQHYKKAVLLYEAIEKMQTTYNMYDASGYSLVLAHLSLSYAYLEDYSQAIRVCDKLLALKKQNDSDVDFGYVEILEYLVSYYMADNNVYKALEEALHIKSIMEGDTSIDDGVRISTLQDISDCYLKLNDIESAIKYQENAILLSVNLSKEDPDKGNKYYIQSLYQLSNIYAYISNYQEAIRILNRCVSFCKEQQMDHSITYAQSLLYLARCNSSTGYKNYAEQLCKESYEIHKKNYGENNQYTLKVQLELATFLAYSGKKKEAKFLGEDAVLKYKKIHGENSHYYAQVLSTLSEMYAIMGAMDLAIERLSECIEIYEKDSLVNSDMQYRLSTYLAYQHDYEKAISLCNAALENNRKGWAEKYLFHTYLADYFYKLSDVENAKSHVLAYMNNIEDSFYNRFMELPYASKKNYWDYYGKRMKEILPLMAYETQDQEIVNMTYNFSALWSKGLLYRADHNFRDEIYKTQDPELINTYLEFNSNKNALFHILTSSEHQERKDSLTNVIQEQEMRLINAVNFRKPNVIKWQDVQENLLANEIAIEFVSYPIDKGEMYIALTLKKDFDAPICHGLFIDDGKNNLKEKCDSLWYNIKEDLEGVTNIYFSPTGIINNIAIEYLPLDSTLRISDKYNVYRLSSTSMLKERRKKSDWRLAILYGNLEYDMTNNPVDHNAALKFSASRGLMDALTTRDSFSPLYYTKTEIEEIAQTLQKEHVKIGQFIGEKGTEESFRNLSGKNVNILHMATHGMYVGKNIEQEKNDKNLLFIQDSNAQYTSFSEDQQMTRSFLVMTGGNMLPQRKEIQTGMDDGILTAQEISLLDFQNLDLVTLSACQTALGDITQDGVIGLQRGFKKAGANTILMSLDKVDDEAAKILMVEFYKNLMSGKSKLQSLKDAQKYLREYDNGEYDKPEYWASFIMLDGLD